MRERKALHLGTASEGSNLRVEVCGGWELHYHKVAQVVQEALPVDGVFYL